MIHCLIVVGSEGIFIITLKDNVMNLIEFYVLKKFLYSLYDALLTVLVNFYQLFTFIVVYFC